MHLPTNRCSRLARALLFVPVVALVPETGAAQTVSSEQVAAALPGLEQMAQKIVAEGGVPGLAIGVVHDDKVVYLKGFGRRVAGKPETVGADTVFQIASLSKPVSSTVVAALVSEGVLSWDSRIADIDPSFRLSQAYPSAELTVRDLFAHRSGLPGTAGDDLEEIGYDRMEILKRLRFVSPSSSFRAGYSYSNFGLTEGGVAAARAAGLTWEDAAEQKLYRPLGMTSTSSRHADFLAHANRASLHVRIGGRWAVAVERNPDAQAPAGGVSTTVGDLAQWMRLELGNGAYQGKTLIAPEPLAQTHVPLMARGRNPVTGAASFYGLGWNVDFGRHGLSWGHAGAFSVGARSLVTLYPDAGLGIVILANAFPTGVPEGLSDSFADLVFDGKAGKDWLQPWNAVYSGMFDPATAAAKATYATPPSPASPARPDAAYAGNYANDFVGDAVVSTDDGGLVLKLGPNGKRAYPLRHFDRDLFLTNPSPELPDMPAAVRFAIGADGRASAMTVGFLDDHGLGTLTRKAD